MLTASEIIKLTRRTTGALSSASSAFVDGASVSVKSIAVSVNSMSIESTDSVSVPP